MKKYPFSKKAVQAMLAASIAAAPLVSYGAVNVEAAEVEAAAYTDAEVHELAVKLNSVYSNLTAEEKNLLNSVYSKFNSFTDEELDYYIKDSAVNSQNIDVASTRALLKAVAGFALNTQETSVEQLEARLNAVINNPSLSVDAVFGTDVKINQVIAYIMDFEDAFISQLNKGDRGSITNVISSLQSAMTTANANPDNAALVHAFKAKFEADKVKNNLYKIMMGVHPIDNGKVVVLSADDIKALAANETITVEMDKGSFEVPVSEIDLSQIAEVLEIAESDIEIVITVREIKVDTDLNTVSPVVEFSVMARDKNDPSNTAELSQFSTFVERTINGTANFDPAHSTAVLLKEDGTFSAVPAVFNGNTATIKSISNGVFAIVQNNKTFSDIQNNWAKAHIEKLASKYIINGKTATAYAPGQDITRGEFAALISRSLGLVAEDAAEVKFPDVPPTKAVNKNGEINAAVEAGILQGFADGTFRPDKPITRAEAAIMIAHAMAFTEADYALDSSKKLAGFKDNAAIGQSSRASIETVVQAGIMSGFGTGNFGPYQNTKRDQMAKVLDKFLQASDLIN